MYNTIKGFKVVHTAKPCFTVRVFKPLRNETTIKLLDRVQKFAAFKFPSAYQDGRIQIKMLQEGGDYSESRSKN